MNTLSVHGYRCFLNTDCAVVRHTPFSWALFSELTFRWIFNDDPSSIVQDTRLFVSQKTGNLYIAKVEPSDVGNYTCVVTNTVTKSSVRGPPTPLVLRADGMTTSNLNLLQTYSSC